MMQRLRCKVNYSMHQQFYYHKKFSDINTTRLFSKFKIIATCDTNLPGGLLHFIQLEGTNCVCLSKNHHIIP